MTAAADRHLLFGLLALQTGIIDQGQLVLAFQAWTLDKLKSLADHLEARGGLDADGRAAVEAMVAVHIKKHGGDVEKSLAAVPANRSARASLAQLGEPEIEATLARVARGKNGPATDAEDDDPDRTASIAVGSATSDGQRFRILRPHARGGLGAVFVALDGELHREVALKQILKKHADDPVSRQRFIAEAEITGGLEHPGVVPVYGLGTDSFGNPYYAMRFIKGESLKEAIAHFHGEPGRVSAGSDSRGEPGRVSAGRDSRGEPGRGSARSDSRGEPGRVSAGRRSRTKTRGADASPLAFRKLLCRFTDVCNAIEYAHSRGVIHRDIKPANIILGKYGETLVVDWGVAKAIGRADPSTGERTIAPSSSGSSETLPGSALGTPAYMSPEQARGELNRLGPRSDVYSLGATLYCLLTGKPPFEGEDIGAILRAVQDGQFQRPSQLDSALDKALEAICLKAMAKELDHRYAAPRALADDLDRWMADEPVTAWREPFSRRARRWARRNRTAVTSAAVALVAGVVGLSAVLAVQTRAKADIARSLASETRANAALAAANDKLFESRAAVQARYDLATAAIKTFHTGVSEDFLLKEDKFKNLRDRLLQSASDFYGKLGALLGKETDMAARRALAQANYELADLTYKVGRTEDALAAHRAVLARREELAADRTADVEARVDVGRSLTAIASLLETTGKTDEAGATYRKAETLLADPARSSPVAVAALAYCRTQFGFLLSMTGKSDDALEAYRLARADQEALAAAPGATNETRRDLALTIHRLGVLLTMTGRPAEATVEYRKALAIYQKLADADPSVAEYRKFTANSHVGLGWVLNLTGNPLEAEAEYRKALALYQKLANDSPAVATFRSELAATHVHLGNLLRARSKPAEAGAEYRTVMGIHQKLVDDNPSVTVFRSNLASNHSSLGLLLMQTAKPAEAEPELRQAITIYQKLANDNPAFTSDRSKLAGSHHNLGALLSDTGKPSEANAEYRAAIAISQKLVNDNPAVTQFRVFLANHHNNLGRLLADTGKPAEAEPELRQAITIYQKLADDNPKVPSYRRGAALALKNLGDLARMLSRDTDARNAYDRAIAAYEQLVKDSPTDANYRREMAGAFAVRGVARRSLGDCAGASADARRALSLFERQPSGDGQDFFQTACCRAVLAGLVGQAVAGVSTAEGKVQADQATALLRKAVDAGYRDLNAFRTEMALDPLRARADFKRLITDLERKPPAQPETSP